MDTAAPIDDDTLRQALADCDRLVGDRRVAFAAARDAADRCQAAIDERFPARESSPRRRFGNGESYTICNVSCVDRFCTCTPR